MSDHLAGLPKFVKLDLPMEYLTLRDYFAACALTGAFRGGDTDVDDAVFARRAYEIATAMMAEREK